MRPEDLESLSLEMEALAAGLATEAKAVVEEWQPWLKGDDYAASAANLAHYLALRRRDLRKLQSRLMAAGLSSLGRSESHVMPTVNAIRNILSLARGAGPCTQPPGAEDFLAGQRLISERANAVLGTGGVESPVRLMVTLPSDAATDGTFALQLAQLGVEAVRINCAHDDTKAWAAMVGHVRAAGAATGKQIRIVMDLPGPKIRTGKLHKSHDAQRLQVGDHLAITRKKRLSEVPRHLSAIECELDAALDSTLADHHIHIDDGKLSTRVLAVEPWGVVVRIEAGPDEKGYKLKPEKGINFPDADLAIPALTDDDRAILPFVAGHADAIDFSFVQTAQDVADLQLALADLRPDDWQKLGLILKIETRLALKNLPDLMVAAAARQPAAVMIARGDLAVEVGFARVAEMQEEILWLCEAAHVPVVWATQVMESYLKTGVPSRGEMTDAAMAARAEGVMLNKGPFLLDCIRMLDALHIRMAEHLAKKTHLLRPLQTW
jgi:pyruvate kinase